MLRALTAPRGMVTAPHHLAAQSGNAVLREGGNAVEAMVAAAATIAVVYPHMNSLGGDGIWLISRPGQEPVGIDASGRAAALATPDWYTQQSLSAIPTRGPLAACTVAGAVSGWQAALRQSGGQLPLARLLQDAIAYAREGAPVTHSQVHYTTRFLDELAPQPGYGATFLRDGAPPLALSVQRFPALADTLEQLARQGSGRVLPGRDGAKDGGRTGTYRQPPSAARPASAARADRGTVEREPVGRACLQHAAADPGAVVADDPGRVRSPAAGDGGRQLRPCAWPGRSHQAGFQGAQPLHL